MDCLGRVSLLSNLLTPVILSLFSIALKCHTKFVVSVQCPSGVCVLVCHTKFVVSIRWTGSGLEVEQKWTGSGLEVNRK